MRRSTSCISYRSRRGIVRSIRAWEWCAGAVSAAHVYGKPIVAAEAFTSMPGENWLAHPASIKALGDWAFCEGINRFIFVETAMVLFIFGPQALEDQDRLFH